MESFESPELLLRRAKSHIVEFETLEKTFVGKKPYRQFVDKDLQNGGVLFKAQINIDMPEFLPVILFDVLNCLRSSLDHAVFDSARILGGTASPKYTKFPFGTTEVEAASDLARKRSEVPEAIRPFLLAFKPFDPKNGGNGSLWGLNELRNGKIHKTLTEMAVANQGVSFNNGYIGRLTVSSMSAWDREKRELTYMRATVAEDVDIQIGIFVFIAFDEGTPFAGKKAVPTLNELLGIVEGVVAGIKAETSRLRAL